ncbi:fibrillin-1-like [Orbicella faveolata]|uniref:fibrillin-1-like n=1 Tax=Orbicella faveolata TaxID=48498 RepID=UPI0009E19C40|nr:fibrillin-1-like [Orbicella faveolata]
MVYISTQTSFYHNSSGDKGDGDVGGGGGGGGDGGSSEFHRDGNSDTVDTHKLPVAVYARYIRFYPTKQHRWNCLRVEVYGTADIDECMANTHDCHPSATCTNTEDSFTCACNEGYTGDGRSCIDVDECADNQDHCHPSLADCFNTEGSYTCHCLLRYVGDGTDCTDVDECQTQDHDCDQDLEVCLNTVGSYTCNCIPGFTGDGKNCLLSSFLDIDEKELADNYSNVSLSISGITQGVWSTSVDLDECASGQNNCHQHAVCSNNISSFTCHCESGYTGDGFLCEDINECANDQHSCHFLAKCSNTEGSYTCSCVLGYQGDGIRQCADLDECASGQHNCHQHADCSNNIGSFTCHCQSGYTGDGLFCEGIL